VGVTVDIKEASFTNIYIYIYNSGKRSIVIYHHLFLMVEVHTAMGCPSKQPDSEIIHDSCSIWQVAEVQVNSWGEAGLLPFIKI